MAMNEVVKMSEEGLIFHEKVDQIKDMKYRDKIISKYLKVANKRSHILNEYGERDFKRMWMFMTFRIREDFPELPKIDESRL